MLSCNYSFNGFNNSFEQRRLFRNLNNGIETKKR